MIRHARQIASVWMHDPEARVVVEAVLAHHQLRVHAPALDELRGVGQQARQRRVAAGDVELEVVAGIRLVDAGVADRGEVVLAHRVRIAVDRRRHDVDALRVAVERRRREVGRERDDVAQVLGRLDDVDALVVRDRHEVVLDEVRAGPEHRGPVGLERRREVGRLVGLDAVDDLGLGRVRVDLARRGRPGRPSPRPASASRARGSASASSPSKARWATRASWRSRPTGQSSVPSGERALEPGACTARRRPWRRRRRASSRRRSASGEGALGGGDDLVEEGRQLGRPSRSRCAARAGPAARPRACAPARGAGARPRAGRRSRRVARPAGRGRARTAGTARRRSCRGRASAAPRCAARRCRRSRGGRCGARGRARSGPSPTGRPGRGASTAVRCARSAASSARTASRPPSPSSSS